MNVKLKSITSSEAFSNLLSSLMAIAAGLLVGFIVLLFSNPAAAWGGFRTILIGGFLNMREMGRALYMATPIMMTGLSVGFAYKTGLFNIGAAGQFIVGAYAAVYVGVKWTFLPGHLHWAGALLAAFAAGALWGLVPGLLKAYYNVHEVIASIMMNYIGMFLVNFLIVRTIFNAMRNETQHVAATAVLPKAGLNHIFVHGGAASSANAGIFFAIAFGILMYIVLEKTRFGFELKAVGHNRDAAQYAGINAQQSILASMGIAGGLAGLGGALAYLAGSGRGIEVVDVLAMEGFNGIPVALLGFSNPLGIIASALFIAHLSTGGFNMQLHGFVPEVIEIIVAVIIYFSALSLLVKGFIEKRLRRRQKANDVRTAEGGALQ